MSRCLLAIVLCAVCMSARAADAHEWIERSNTYTRRLLEVDLEHSPERGSRQGLAKFDERISDPSLADELAQRRH
jgi:hypothetical protein